MLTAGGAPAFNKSSCDANRTLPIVLKKCVGQKSCELSPSAMTYGEPCVGAKHLDVAVACALPPLPAGARVLSMSVAVPVGVQARLTLPLAWGRRATDVLVTCLGAMYGEQLVWAKGRFTPGVHGISSAQASEDGGSVAFELASGEYTFLAS